MSTAAKKQSPITAVPSVGPQRIWEVGDIGFDTDKKLWFVTLYNDTNQNVGSFMAKSIVLRRGKASQYEWKDAQGKAFWHVRERFFADEIEDISIDPDGNRLALTFKVGEGREAESQVPSDYSYLLYAFHLANKELEKGNKPPMGFVEFYDLQGSLISKINNFYISVEDIDRKSVGEYPKIRLRIEKSDIDKIIITRSRIIIQGKLVRS